MDAAQLGHIIARIYDAALSPDNWGSALDQVADAVGARGAIVFHLEPRYTEIQEGGNYYNRLFVAEDIRTYIDQYAAQDRLDLVLARDPLSILHLQDILERDPDFVDTPLHHWLKDRFNVLHRSAARLNDVESWTAVVTVQFDAARDRMNIEEARILRQLLPHVAKAVEVNRPVRLLEARYNAVLDALDRITIGVCIATSSGQIVIANRCLELVLREGSGVQRAANGRLMAVDSATDVALRKALIDAVATSTGAADRPETILTAPCQNQRSVLLMVCPLKDNKGDLGRRFAGAIVYCIDPDASHVFSTAGMNELFGFTTAENEIAICVAEGLSNRQVAERRDVSPETVKTQIASMFAKAGVSNRYEFLRLTLRVNLPVESV